MTDLSIIDWVIILTTIAIFIISFILLLYGQKIAKKNYSQLKSEKYQKQADLQRYIIIGLIAAIFVPEMLFFGLEWFIYWVRTQNITYCIYLIADISLMILLASSLRLLDLYLKLKSYSQNLIPK